MFQIHIFEKRADPSSGVCHNSAWSPSYEKKVPFILSALQELRQRHERDFDNEEPLGAKHVLMIDDDMMNVMACEMNGIRAVHLDSDLIIEGRNRCEEQVASGSST